MDIKALKEEAKIGNISKEYIDYLKLFTMNEKLTGRSQKAANTLVTYAHFLNRRGIDSDNYPLYLRLLSSNNRYAADALLEGYEPEEYFDCVVPNPFIVKAYSSADSSGGSLSPPSPT